MTKTKEIINEIHSVLSLKKGEMGGFSPKRELDTSPSKLTFDPNSNLVKELL
jgi:hypothetical protein